MGWAGHEFIVVEAEGPDGYLGVHYPVHTQLKF